MTALMQGLQGLPVVTPEGASEEDYLGESDPEAVTEAVTEAVAEAVTERDPETVAESATGEAAPEGTPAPSSTVEASGPERAEASA